MADTAAPATDKTRRPATTRVGLVTSDKRQKTRTVAVDFSVRHPKYGKYVRKTVKYHVHDETEESRTGDRVEIASCRPLSKSKSWRLVRIVEEGVRHEAQH